MPKKKRKTPKKRITRGPATIVVYQTHEHYHGGAKKSSKRRAPKPKGPARAKNGRFKRARKS